MSSTNGESAVQSVDRAIAVLEILARRGDAGVTEVAGELGVHKSTACRLLAALEGRDLVEQLAERGKYRLGFGIIRLAGATSAQLDLSRESRPVCVRLAREVGETVNVAVLADSAAVNVTQVRGSAAIISHNWVGQRTPLHATSSGKVLLAFAPDPVRHRLIGSRPLRRFTARTTITPVGLAAQLDEVRARGYSCTVEEFEVGLNAVAAPIYGQDGSVIAALSASGPSYRLGAGAVPKIADAVKTGAAEISVRVGHLG